MRLQRILAKLFYSGLDKGAVKTTRCLSHCSALLLLLLFMVSGCQLFPTEAGEELAHFGEQAPQPGDTLPDLRVLNLDGSPVLLSSLVQGKPLVVRLGSYSCPVFRYRRFDMDKLQRRYGDRVDFVVIYTQEAHPVDDSSPYAEGEWDPWINRLTRVRVREPKTQSERLKRARWAQSVMAAKDRFVVDDQANNGWHTLGRAPSSAFLFDRTGTLVLRQVWIEPEELATALDRLF